jgi:5-bromo-4-chloroindolyl phosphate hydrolysis protein
MEFGELEQLERLEQVEEDLVEAENLKQNQGGGRMKARKRRNIEGMLEKLKRLQKAIKESQKLYYVEQGRAVLQWYQLYKENKAGARELEERLKEVAELFGKSLDEPLE